MIYQADIDKWYHNQTQFTVRHFPPAGLRVEMYILRDLKGNFDVNVFDGELEAREFAFQMVHGIIHKEDQDGMDDTTFTIRRMMLIWERDILVLLGLPEVQNNQLRMNTLLMMKDMVGDALGKGPKLVGGMTG